KRRVPADARPKGHRRTAQTQHCQVQRERGAEEQAQKNQLRDSTAQPVYAVQGREAPLPPTPSPKRRGGAEGLAPPLRFGEGVGGRGFEAGVPADGLRPYWGAYV